MLTREFFNWMEARETIRLKRAAREPGPWTSDPILSTYRFTNVMREHDRVSVWIHNNITTPFLNSEHLWITLALARQINAIDSLADILLSGVLPRTRWTYRALQQVWKLLDDRKAAGKLVFTSAYMIHADSSPATSDIWRSKAHYVVMMVVGQLLGKTPPLTSLEAFTKFLSQYESWGGFMAYEVACDLRWAKGWLDTAPDIYTWANPGPGAKRGLNRIHDRALNAPVRVEQQITEMRYLLRFARERNWKVKWTRPFEMRDIEHSLCEFDKYQRVLRNEGKPKQKFVPVT
jgi:hypothetical protein